jgi:hypothetical protein
MAKSCSAKEPSRLFENYAKKIVIHQMTGENNGILRIRHIAQNHPDTIE